MGLDVTAYERAERISGHEPTDDDYDHGIIEAFTYAPFARSLDGMGELVDIPDRRFVPGCTSAGYWRTSGLEAFAQTSYGLYGRYRDALALAVLGTDYAGFSARVDEFAGCPFFDLLYFADNEGTFGPVASRRLADAYTSVPVEFDAGWMRVFHDDLRDCFELAADTGLVQFS